MLGSNITLENMEQVLKVMVLHSKNQEIMASTDVMLEIIEEIIPLLQNSGIEQYELISNVFILLHLYF